MISQEMKDKDLHVEGKDLIKELLNNPRVESITINIERVGDVEETRVNANLTAIKELNIDCSNISEKDTKKALSSVENICRNTIVK